MEESQRSEEFHEWLSECPCAWLRLDEDEDSTTYKFIE